MTTDLRKAIEGLLAADDEWLGNRAARERAREALAASDDARVVLRYGDAEVELMREALHSADMFITNGVALGYIRMPDADCPDPALKTPGLIKAALALTCQEKRVVESNVLEQRALPERFSAELRDDWRDRLTHYGFDGFDDDDMRNLFWTLTEALDAAPVGTPVERIQILTCNACGHQPWRADTEGANCYFRREGCKGHYIGVDAAGAPKIGEHGDNDAAMVKHLTGLLRQALPYVEGDGRSPTTARTSLAERIGRRIKRNDEQSEERSRG